MSIPTKLESMAETKPEQASNEKFHILNTVNTRKRNKNRMMKNVMKNLDDLHSQIQDQAMMNSY